LKLVNALPQSTVPDSPRRPRLLRQFAASRFHGSRSCIPESRHPKRDSAKFFRFSGIGENPPGGTVRQEPAWPPCQPTPTAWPFFFPAGDSGADVVDHAGDFLSGGPGDIECGASYLPLRGWPLLHMTASFATRMRTCPARGLGISPFRQVFQKIPRRVAHLYHFHRFCHGDFLRLFFDLVIHAQNLDARRAEPAHIAARQSRQVQNKILRGERQDVFCRDFRRDAQATRLTCAGSSCAQWSAKSL